MKYSFITSEFAVTNKRVIAKIGLIGRNTLELFLTKVESIQIIRDLFPDISAIRYSSKFDNITEEDIYDFHTGRIIT